MKGQYIKSDEHKSKISESCKHAKKGSKPVIELTTGLTFGSAHLAGRHFKITVYRIYLGITQSMCVEKDGKELRFEYLV